MNPQNMPDFHDLFVRVYALLIGLSFGLGAVIASGGRQRFSGPSFEGPRDLTRWLPLLPPYMWWGVMFLLYGGLLILTLGRPLAIHVLRFGIVVFFFLAASLLWSTFQNPVAALTGVIVYGVIALLFGVMQDHLRSYGWRH